MPPSRVVSRTCTPGLVLLVAACSPERLIAWLVRRPKRPARGVLMVGCRLLVSAGLLGGCSSPSSPSLPTVYSLVSIRGHPLPATFDAFVDSDGALRTLEAVSARLELRPDGTFRRQMDATRRLDGEFVESLRSDFTGTAERTSTTSIVLRYKNPGGGYNEQVGLELFEGGSILREISMGRMWEWVREEPSP